MIKYPVSGLQEIFQLLYRLKEKGESMASAMGLQIHMPPN